MFLVGPPQGRRDTPGDLLASGSCKHGHGHALPLLAGATYSIGLSTPPIFTFFPRDPAARSSNRSGIWDHGMSKSSWLKFRFIRNSVAFLSLFFPNSDQIPNINYGNQALPGACSCSAKLTFPSVLPLVAQTWQLSAGPSWSLALQFNKSSANLERFRLSKLFSDKNVGLLGNFRLALIGTAVKAAVFTRTRSCFQMSTALKTAAALIAACCLYCLVIELSISLQA